MRGRYETTTQKSARLFKPAGDTAETGCRKAADERPQRRSGPHEFPTAHWPSASQNSRPAGQTPCAAPCGPSSHGKRSDMAICRKTAARMHRLAGKHSMSRPRARYVDNTPHSNRAIRRERRNTTGGSKKTTPDMSSIANRGPRMTNLLKLDATRRERVRQWQEEFGAMVSERSRGRAARRSGNTTHRLLT